MQLLVIDGQGGKIGRTLIENLRSAGYNGEIIAIGTNAMATAAMKKAGADGAATGENPVLINAPKARLIAGPIGILAANALLGEITPAMAAAVSASDAQKILIPMDQCHVWVAGKTAGSVTESIALAVEEIIRRTGERKEP